MAFYKYNEITRELVEVSDLPMAPDTNLPVSEINISKADLLDHYQWDSDVVMFVDRVSRILTKAQFLKRLTPQEYAAIKQAASQNGEIDYYWQLFMVADHVNIDDPDTIMGVTLLSAAGLLSAERVTEILF